MSQGGGRSYVQESPPPLTPPHHALRKGERSDAVLRTATGGRGIESRSRDAFQHPSYGRPLSELVTTGHSRSQNGVLRTPMPVVHAEAPHVKSRWKALYQRNFRMDCRHRRVKRRRLQTAMSGNDEGKKNEENIGSETPTDARLLLPCLTDTAAPGAPGAHLSAFHRGSRPKESFISRDAAPGQASCDAAGTRFAHPFERALPAPACPSPAIAPRAPVIVPER